MSQVPTSEQLPGGPLQLTVGDQSFTVSQQLIMLGTQKVREAGVLPKDLPGFPPAVIKGANPINAMLNSIAAEAKTDSSINVFFFELGRFDSVFLRALMNTGSQNADFMEMLIIPSGQGKTFVDALQTIDKPAMQELIGQTLRINSGQRINDSNIVADNLVVFPQSATEIAQNAMKNPANLPSLYAQNKNKITVHKIPSNIETLPISSQLEPEAFPSEPPKKIDLRESVVHSDDKIQKPSLHVWAHQSY